ncbi:protein of unknown function (plasmid) [Cupriavidus taiwanensis]|uniref:Uncharacterized protein n=1 Tax=Cupriavidus taiwanensis TaxID=164546 RepID=A0A375ISJ6_9BURK|nr:protein of unknown function [Cupriavidus taiwanensis]
MLLRHARRALGALELGRNRPDQCEQLRVGQPLPPIVRRLAGIRLSPMALQAFLERSPKHSSTTESGEATFLKDWKPTPWLFSVLRGSHARW